jgi:hypothetical protein
MPIKIADLPAITTIDVATDVLPIVDTSENITKKISVSQITGIIPPITINGTPLEPGDSLTIPAVTSVSTNNGITGGPITGVGTIGLTGTALSLHNLSTSGIVSKSGTTLSTVPGAISINGTPVALGNSASIGTVTSIATNDGITGGTITGAGTIGLTGTALSLHSLTGTGVIKKTGATTLSTVSDTITINGVAAALGNSVTIPVGGAGTVTSVGTNTLKGTTGGPINSAGTIELTGQALAFHELAGDGLVTKNGSTISVTNPTSLATAPASPINSVQFNNGGVFGGSSNLTWDNANGRLGIGISPEHLLDVRTSTAVPGQGARIGEARIGTFIGSTDKAEFAHQSLFGGSTTYAITQDALGNTDINAAVSRKITFNIAGTGVGAIDSDGEFGIGTTAPTQRLHVVGNALINGNITGSNALINGSITGSSALINGDLAVNGGDITSTATILNINAGAAVGIKNDLFAEGLIFHSGSYVNKGFLIKNTNHNFSTSDDHTVWFISGSVTGTLPQINIGNVGIEYVIRKTIGCSLLLRTTSPDTIEFSTISSISLTGLENTFMKIKAVSTSAGSNTWLLLSFDSIASGFPVIVPPF